MSQETQKETQKRRGLEEIMGDKRTSAVIAVVGTFVVIGIILYQSGGALSPLMIAAIISTFIMVAIVVYAAFFMHKQ